MAGAVTSQRTAAVPAKAPGAARFSLVVFRVCAHPTLRHAVGVTGAQHRGVLCTERKMLWGRGVSIEWRGAVNAGVTLV